MKKIVSLKIVFICMMFVLTLGFKTVDAASFSISASSATMYVGDSTSVTVNASGVAGGPFTVTSSNSAVATVSGLNGGWLENNSDKITITGKSAGTAVITIKATVANLDNSADESTVTKTITVTVKEKEVKPPVNNNTGTGSASGNNNNTTTVKKSSDATLKALKVDVEGLNPTFNKNTYLYTLTVSSEVESLKVTASTNHSKAKYTVSGNTNLKDGDNTVTIKVTAENGSTKTYKIIVTKAENPEKANAYLTNIVIDNAELSEEFVRENMEYVVTDVTYDVTKLQLSAFPENSKATVVVEGNDELKVGENIIKIIVTAEDGKTTKEYTVKVNRKEEPKTEIQDDVVEQNSLTQTNSSGFLDTVKENKESQLLILVYILAVVEFIEIIYLFFQLRDKDSDKSDGFDITRYKRRKNKKEDEK